MFNKIKYFILLAALSLTVGYAQNSFAHAFDHNLTGDELKKDGSLPRQAKVVLGHGAHDDSLTANDLRFDGSLPRQEKGGVGYNDLSLTGDDLNPDGSLPPM